MTGADWLADHKRASTAIDGLCGTAGCLQQLYVSRSDGSFRLAFAAQAFGLKVSGTGASMPNVFAAMHGVHWGGTGCDECRIALEWSELASALVPVARKGSATTIAAVNILADAPLPPPPAVARKLAVDRAGCIAAGMTLSDADVDETALSLPRAEV